MQLSSLTQVTEARCTERVVDFAYICTLQALSPLFAGKRLLRGNCVNALDIARLAPDVPHSQARYGRRL